MKDRIASLVNAINRVGIENVALLSRLTGIPTETVRYMIKKRFPELGLFVGLHVDYDKLGLERNFAILEFAPDIIEHAPELLKTLSKGAFLTYRCREVLRPRDIANFGVPASQKRLFRSFLDQMLREKILLNFKIEPLEWVRNLALRSEYYDFKQNRWSIDWKRVSSLKEPPPAPPMTIEPPIKPDIDLTDLLVIKELELQSWRSFSDIANRIGINDRTVRWHHTKHVKPLIRSFHVHRLSVGSEGLAKLVGLIHGFNHLSREEFKAVRLLFNNFPFTWNEAGRNDGYYRVVSTIPSEYFVEALQFLNANLQKQLTKWEVYTLDMSTSHWYTIPYENYGRNGWYFDSDRAMNAMLLVRNDQKIRGI